MHATMPMFDLWPNSEESTLFLRKLLENETFKNEFAQRSCTYTELLFHPERVDRITDSIAELIDPFVDQTLEKWGENNPELGWSRAMGGSRVKWEENIQLYKDFFVERPSFIRKFIAEYCRFEGSYRLDLNLKESTHGKVLVNSNRKEVPPGFGTDYFINVPVKLSAVPDEGYAFYKWEEIDETNPDIDFISSKNVTLTPLFIPSSSVREYERPEINIYPNPSSGIINIQFVTPAEGSVSVQVFSSIGQMVLNEQLSDLQASGNLLFDLSDQEEGVYWLRISSDKIQKVEQIILIR